jgi:hypothetical protein
MRAPRVVQRLWKSVSALRAFKSRSVAERPRATSAASRQKRRAIRSHFHYPRLCVLFYYHVVLSQTCALTRFLTKRIQWTRRFRLCFILCIIGAAPLMRDVRRFMAIDFVTVPLLCATMATAGYAFIIFDRLVRTEYEHYNEHWIADGEPSGVFWRPQGRVRRRNWRALGRVSWSWLFRRPAWVTQGSENMKALTRYRISNCVLLAIFLMFLMLLFLLLFAPNKITRANAGGARHLPARTHPAARIAQFARSQDRRSP